MEIEIEILDNSVVILPVKKKYKLDELLEVE
jgi:hypothetical protein